MAPQKPKRIVSLTPVTTEMMFALDLGNRVKGVSQACDYPEVVCNLPKTGPVFKPDIEKIISFKPDLVLAQGDFFDSLKAPLAEKGLELKLIDPATVAEILDSILWLGELTDTGEKAADLVKSIQNLINETKSLLAGLKQAEKPLTMRLMEADPPIVAGNNSFMSDVIRLAGGRNPYIPHSSAYPRLNPEEIARLNPEALWICGWNREELQVLAGLPGWRETRAIKDQRLLVLPCGLSCRAGPRVGVLIKKLAGALNPDRF